MDIETSVTLSVKEEAQLVAVLGGDAAGLPQKLAELGRAALREYVDMILGETIVRSPEVREQRLVHIILEAYQGRVPTEAEVSQLFGMTHSSARSLLRSVLSRHRLRLNKAVVAAAKDVLAQCGTEQDGARRVSVANPVIVEYLNEVLADVNGALKQIRAESRTGTIYSVPEDSFLALDAKLNP